MVAAAFVGRHHVVIHYVITYCFFCVGPAMCFRLWPLLFLFGFGPAMFFRLWPLLFYRLWPRHVFSAFWPLLYLGAGDAAPIYSF